MTQPPAFQRPSFSTIFRLLFREKSGVWPKWVENTHPLDLPQSLSPGQVAVTFINHASFLLQSRACNLLLDPVYSQRASPVSWAGPRRVRAASPAFDQLPEIHIVFVTHNHYDHMDIPFLKRLKTRFNPLFVTGQGNEAYLKRHGITRVLELDWWQR